MPGLHTENIAVEYNKLQKYPVCPKDELSFTFVPYFIEMKF